MRTELACWTACCGLLPEPPGPVRSAVRVPCMLEPQRAPPESMRVSCPAAPAAASCVCTAAALLVRWRRGAAPTCCTQSRTTVNSTWSLWLRSRSKASQKSRSTSPPAGRHKGRCTAM